MARVANYYNTSNRTDYIDYGKALNLFLREWLSNTLMNGGTQKVGEEKDYRVIYCDNGEAFRKRSDDIPSGIGNIDLPFINFTVKGYGSGDEFDWYRTGMDKRGVYIPELKTTVQQVPLQIEYEATFWCALTNEMRFIADRLWFYRENHTDLRLELEYEYTDDFGDKQTVTVPHYVKLNFEALTVDPEYERDAWLEENVKHSIQMDFTVYTWAMKLGGQDVSITEKSILRITGREDGEWQDIIEEV